MVNGVHFVCFALEITHIALELSGIRGLSYIDFLRQIACFLRVLHHFYIPFVNHYSITMSIISSSFPHSIPMIISSLPTQLSRDLIPHSSEQRCVFTVIGVRVAVRHLLEFAILDGTDSPGAGLLGLFEEHLVLLEAATARFGLVEVGPDSGEHVCEAEDEEEPVVEVVEEDGCQKSHGKVGQAPHNDADGSALGSCGGRKDLRGNQL